MTKARVEPTARDPWLHGLLQAGSALGAATGVEEVAETLLREARRLLRCQAGALRLVDHDGLSLVVAHNELLASAALTAKKGDRCEAEGTVAGHVARTRAPLMVADVATLVDPRWDGAAELALGFRTRALLAVPLLGRDQRALAVLELQNPLTANNEPTTFTHEQEDLARVLAAQAALALERASEVARLEADQVEALFAFACVPEHRDADIRWHVRRIAGYSRVLATAAGLDAGLVRSIELASALHDIGKVAIPPEVLFKPGKLTDDEFRITREHCALGHQLLAGAASPLLRLAGVIAHGHHERWDGGGYPSGARGQGIDVAARVVAIADVFDALTTRRSYKPALGVEQSLRIIGMESGKHFDPDLVDAFHRVFSDVLDVKRRFTPEE